MFVVGDASSVMRDGKPVPGVAQAAIQQGRYVGRLIARHLKGREPKHPFRYFDLGNMAVVGKNFAILESGRLRMSGFRHLVGLGFRPSYVASTAAKPVSGARPVVLVIFHRTAQLAIDPGAAEGRNS